VLHRIHLGKPRAEPQSHRPAGRVVALVVPSDAHPNSQLKTRLAATCIKRQFAKHGFCRLSRDVTDLA